MDALSIATAKEVASTVAGVDLSPEYIHRKEGEQRNPLLNESVLRGVNNAGNFLKFRSLSSSLFNGDISGKEYDCQSII